MLKARPTVYKGIKMRSRLEAGFASWLDEWFFKWEYEPSAFASEDGQYLPDFKLIEVPCSWRGWEPQTVYVEVKPKAFGEDPTNPEFAVLMRAMAVIWESEPDAQLILVQPQDPDDAYAEVGMLNRKMSPAKDPKFPWPQSVVWTRSTDGKSLGLAAPLGALRGPWPANFWKVG